jgi:hypothetical protein
MNSQWLALTPVGLEQMEEAGFPHWRGRTQKVPKQVQNREGGAYDSTMQLTGEIPEV